MKPRKSKQSMINRIRGWFPQEPYLGMRNHQLTQTPMANQQMTTPPVGASSLRRATLLFPILLLLSYLVFDVTLSAVNLRVGEIATISGLAVGALISWPLTKSELFLLSQRGRISGLRASLPSLCLMLPLAAVIPLTYFCSASVVGIYIDVCFAVFLGEFVSNLFLCFRWEHHTKKRIYVGRGGWWGEIYAVTQLNNTTSATVNRDAGRS